MKTIDEVVITAKEQLTRFGRLLPTILIEGTNGNEAIPLPDLAEPQKLSVLEALGFTYARENRVGKLVQLFLVAEAWRSTRNGPHPSLKPQHDPKRVECVMVSHYRIEPEARRMSVYDIVRNDAGELIELTALPNQGHAVESPPLDAMILGFKRGAVEM